MRHRIRAFGLAVAVVAVATIGSRHADAQRTRVVPLHFRSIQAAIDNAAPRDLVLVAPGTYREAINFRGKDIVVRSTHGSALTTIDAGGISAPVVTFSSGETRAAVIEGFSLVGGTGRQSFLGWFAHGGGVYCFRASPTIRGNLITNNFPGSNWIYGFQDPRGGGIYTAAGSPLIIGNRITGNGLYVDSGIGRGGGVYVGSGHAVLVNNVIDRNGFCGRCRDPQSNMIGGSGVEVDGAATLVNNTIVDNRWSNRSSWPSSGGLIAGPTCTVYNCIIRDNQVNEIVGNPTVVHCNVKGGFAGAGNFDAPPNYVDPATYRLSWQSPCIDRGTNVVPLPTFDGEGDVRVAGRAVDVGADETHPHVGLVGAPKRGAKVSLVVWGPPSAPLTLGTASRALRSPLVFPGTGDLWLDPTALRITPLPPLDAQGRAELKVAVPANAPLATIAVQALVGRVLTNPVEVSVLP